jgi:pilus assembly protein CpaB
VLDSLRSRLPRLPRRLRLALAGGCLLLAALSLLSGRGAAAGSPTVRVVVAARALPAGPVLAAADLAVRSWPRGLAPSGVTARAPTLVGRRIAGPLGRGEALTPVRLVGRDLTSGLPVGTVAVPVTVAGSRVIDFVRAGDRVDVLATPPPDPATGAVGAARPLAEAVRVLAVLPGGAAAEDSGAGDAGATLVVATDRATAARLVSTSSSGSVLAVAGSP